MPHSKRLKLVDVWRTCNKVRAAVFRMGINLFEYFTPLDPHKTCLISISQFISVLNGKLRATIGLSEQECAELADYFRVPDGRIYYIQLCQVIHDSIPVFVDNEPLVSGLEWEDPMHSNRLSISEERRLCVVIRQIALKIKLRRLLLSPYFFDYEMVAKNNGTVTIEHFARILAQLNILVSPDDFNLLVKKFIKDSYTLNYVAFTTSVTEMIHFMYKNDTMPSREDVVDTFTARVINGELPKLVRPEIGKILASELFGKQNIFHPALKDPKEVRPVLTTLTMIQDHVLKNRIRVCEFFKDFDYHNCGRITVSQFQRGLDALTLNGRQRLFLTTTDVEGVTHQYRDPCDPTRVCWQTFEDDINHVFTVKGLEKMPSLIIDSPPEAVRHLPRLGGKNWQSISLSLRQICEEAVDKVKQKIIHRRIMLKPVFRDYDKHNNGHVSRNQMRQALLSYGIFLSDEELFALEERYHNDMGFNYSWFLKDVGPKPLEEPIYASYLADTIELNKEKPKRTPTRLEKDIGLVLAKVKGNVVRKRIRVMEFLRDFDRHNNQVISKVDFQRGLSNCGFELTENEVETITDVFASPLRRGYVDYRRFSNAVEEVFTQVNLERSPLLIPIQYVPTKDCERNFLSFDQRHILSEALKKLCKQPDMQMNLSEVLKDFDKTKCGTVSKAQFLKALTLRRMSNMIDEKEFEVICKCFSYERGMRDEIDYRAFMNVLDILHATEKHNPF